MTKSSLLAVALGLCLAGCSSSEPEAGTDGGSGTGSENTDSGTETNTGPSGAPPTYYQDVAPILAKSCVSCHQAGGAGLFSLDSYDSAKKMARAAAHAVTSKSMPPWLARDDGSCGEYKESPVLTDAQIKIIADWAETGTLEGTPATIENPPPKKLEKFVELTTPKYVPESKGGALTQSDEYRCFFLENPSKDKRRYLDGYEVLPGNDALVHHAVMFVVPGKEKAMDGKMTNLEKLQENDDKSPDKAGWPCYSMVGEGVNPVDLPVVWAPGQGAVELAPGTGSIIDKDDVLVLQIHYNLADPSVVGQSDQTKLRVRLAESIERQSLGLAWDDLLETLREKPFVMAPGKEKIEFKTDRALNELGFAGLPFIDIQGFMPHMHGAGLSQRLEKIEGDESVCLSDVPRWDFDWQFAYFFKEPLRLMPEDVLRNTCWFGTKDRSTPTTPGWGTMNEMCLATLFVLLPPGIESR